jgi:hypothetical protein
MLFFVGNTHVGFRTPGKRYGIRLPKAGSDVRENGQGKGLSKGLRGAASELRIENIRT